MTDNLTQTQRSYTMSRIRSRWTKQEWEVHNWLKTRKIRHKMHPDIAGSPDVVLKDSRTVLFLHGCFWHACPRCFIEPQTRRSYWLPKIKANQQRDKQNRLALKKAGWNVKVIWEHELKKDFKKACSKILQ